MLNYANKIHRLSLPFLKKCCFLASTHSISDIKNHYLYVVADPTHQLSFLREVETEHGARGIVLKMDHQGNTYVGMYLPIDPVLSKTQITFKQNNLDWKKSFQGVSKKIQNNHNKKALIFDPSGKIGFEQPIQSGELSVDPPIQTAQGLNHRRLETLSPILNICYDLPYGDLNHFSGCKGSRKTSTIKDIFSISGKKQKHLNLYLNAKSFSETKELTLQGNNTFGFHSSGGDDSSSKQTDVGVYMLAVKTIALANQLKNEGYDALLVLDNFRHILTAEWSMLQMLQSYQKKKFGDNIQYNSMKISPISILNEIYSNCIDNKTVKSHIRIKSKDPLRKEGSLTAIIVTEKDTRDELLNQITPYTNNLKHLESLCPTIQFPYSIKINNNVKRGQTSPSPSQSNQQKSTEDHYCALRTQINTYLTDKNYSQLRRKLYKDEVKHAPWDYYHQLDSEWWINSLSSFRPVSRKQNEEFIRWINYNIEEDSISQWKLTVSEGFNKYKQFLARRQLPFTRQTFVQFLAWGRMEGVFSAFKKDYLA